MMIVTVAPRKGDLRWSRQYTSTSLQWFRRVSFICIGTHNLEHCNRQCFPPTFPLALCCNPMLTTAWFPRRSHICVGLAMRNMWSLSLILLALSIFAWHGVTAFSPAFPAFPVVGSRPGSATARCQDLDGKVMLHPLDCGMLCLVVDAFQPWVS